MTTDSLTYLLKLLNVYQPAKYQLVVLDQTMWTTLLKQQIEFQSSQLQNILTRLNRWV